MSHLSNLFLRRFFNCICDALSQLTFSVFIHTKYNKILNHDFSNLSFFFLLLQKSFFNTLPFSCIYVKSNQCSMTLFRNPLNLKSKKGLRIVASTKQQSTSPPCSLPHNSNHSPGAQKLASCFHLRVMRRPSTCQVTNSSSRKPGLFYLALSKPACFYPVHYNVHITYSRLILPSTNNIHSSLSQLL